MKKSAIITVKGRVQRAGFRHYVKDKAKEHNLLGAVQNLRNYGEDVLILVEGRGEDIRGLVKDLEALKTESKTRERKEAPTLLKKTDLMLVRVDAVDVQYQEGYPGRFTDFNIVRDQDELAERQDEGLHQLIALREENALNFKYLDGKYDKFSKKLEELPKEIARELASLIKPG